MYVAMLKIIMCFIIIVIINMIVIIWGFVYVNTS